MSLSNKTISYIEKNCNCSLSGKTAIITGANSGIGLKTAETLIYKGATVYLACRSTAKAEASRNALLSEYKDADIRILKLDMADFSSIDRFINELPDFDIFINNAGIFHHPGEKTKDGFNLVIGTNYFGVYYLSEKLLPKIKGCGCDITYINTVSLIHKFAHIDYERFYIDRGAYSRSKLCLVRYTESLAKKYAGTNVHIYMTHPGIAITKIANHIIKNASSLAGFLPFNSVEKSSLSALFLLSQSVPDGSIVGPSKLFGGWGYPKVNKKVKRGTAGIDELIEFTEGVVSGDGSR